MSADAFEELGCARTGCGQVIVVHAPIARRWRQTHETFYCPAGHSQWFRAGKTAEEKRIEELECEVARLHRWLRSAQQGLHHCRWVGCYWTPSSEPNVGDYRALHTHMRAAHGMPTLAAVREQQGDQAA